MQVFWFEVSWLSDNTVQVELMHHFCLQCVVRSQVIYEELLVEACVFSAMGKQAELEAEMEKNIEALRLQSIMHGWLGDAGTWDCSHSEDFPGLERRMTLLDAFTKLRKAIVAQFLRRRRMSLDLAQGILR